MRIVRLSGGQLLYVQARQAQHLYNRAAAPSRPSQQFVGQTCDNRQHGDSAYHADNHIGPSHKRVHQHRDNHNEYQEAGSAARMYSVEGLCILRRQFQPLFETVDGLMLRTMILEYRLDVRHFGDQHHVEHENQHAGNPFYQILQQDAVCYIRQPAHSQGRQDHKQAHTHGDGQNHGQDHENLPGLFLAQLFFYPDVEFILFISFRIEFFQLVGGVHEHLGTLHQRGHEIDHAADQRNLTPLAALRAWFCLHVNPAVRQAEADGSSLRAAHHDPFNYGLAADGGRAGIFHKYFL